MSSRITEKVTLHFDLSHCPPDLDYSLGALGVKHSLTQHTPETLARHSQTNKALAMLSAQHQTRVTHFVEDVELPADAVGIHLVTYPSKDPNSIPDLALSFIHIPTSAKRSHFRQKRKLSNIQPHASSLTHFGVSLGALSAEEAAAVQLDATLMITPFQVAESIVFQHPDLLTIKLNVAANVILTHIAGALKADNTLPQYLSLHGPGSSDPYATTITATNPQTGANITPVTKGPDGKTIVDKDGNPLKWPKDASGQNIIQNYTLSAGVVGTTDGKQKGAASSVLNSVLRSTKNDRSLNGESWSIQRGITSTQQANVQPRPPSAALAAVGGDAGFQWNLSNKTSTYGLDIDSGSLNFDSSNANLSFNVKNWANRYLGAYVQFFDVNGDPIKDPYKTGTDASKIYVTNLSSGNTLAGIPIWTDFTPIKFAVPTTASKADVLLGGMGIGNYDSDVDIMGIVMTGLFNYAVPTALIAVSVGTTGARLALGTLDDTEISLAINVCKGFLGAPAVIITALKNPKGLISMFGGIAIGLIFSPGLEKLAIKYAGFTTATELFEKLPVVGWAFQIASLAAGIGDMIATTVEVLLSPATYNIEAARVINVQVGVSPDPTHGTGGQAPIWPTQADHWEVVVQYKGGTSVKQSGSMDSIKPDKPLSVLFSGSTAISAAPGAQIQISANFYSKTDWLCGKWSSAWMAAVADSGTTLNVNGAIVEFLVPLTNQTQYGHYQKLVYQNGHHVWQKTSTPPAGVLTSLGCQNTGNQLCIPVDVTINDLAYALAYCYRASGQGLPLDFGTDPSNTQMYAFQSISVLGNPEAGMKQPSVGMTLQPYIAYDQFGPAPLFQLASATYMAELDASGGKPVPADIKTAFANASGSSSTGGPGTGTGNFTLPDGCVVTVVTASAEWYIGPPGKPLYDLRRETDEIGIFSYPTPAFSPRNFYLDSRTFAKEQKYYLRQVVLDDKSPTFNYTPGKSWGAFADSSLDAIVVHPNGYVIGVNYGASKMFILELPPAQLDDSEAPLALPMSGQGLREGLLNGPVALNVTPDGRILVLEQDNARIQAFDTMANPVQCFAGPLAFTMDAQFKADLNSNKISTGFQQAYQKSVQPQLAPTFSLPVTSTETLNAGTVTADIKQQFTNNGAPLSDNGPYQVLTTVKDSVWLLIDQGAGTSYDIRKNLYVNLDGQEIMTLPASLIPDLNAEKTSAALIQEFADYGVTLSSAAQVTKVTDDSEWLVTDGDTMYDITVQSNAYAYLRSTLLFNLPWGTMSGITKSGMPPPQNLIDLFTGHGITLSTSLVLNIVTAGTAWQLVDQGNNVTYDINTEDDLDVFHAPSFSVEVVAQNTHWVLRDTVNTLTFDIKPDATNASLLDVQQLVSIMALKDGVSQNIHYLDVGVETKGFVYVLSYQGTGSAQSDYHLDIYSPDGTWLSRTPENPNSPGVNGARMIVDQWRNLYTLNYDVILGPNNRTEPSVSTWVPSTPK